MPQFAYPVLAVLIWAGNTVVSKAAAGLIDPAAISLYRWSLAALVLTPLCWRVVWRARAAIWAHAGQYATLALLGMVLYQSLAYFAAHATSATNMGVICALMPLLGLLLNALLFSVRPGKLAVLGVAVSLAGVLYLLGQGQPASLWQHGVNRGDGLMLLGTAAYALYGILLRRWQLPLGHWFNLYVQILFSLLALLPLAATATTLSVSHAAAGLVLYAGLASSILAAYCWMQGVAQLGSEQAAIYMNLLPLFTAIMAMFCLGERLASYHWLGGAGILCGVLLVQWPSLRGRPLRLSKA